MRGHVLLVTGLGLVWFVLVDKVAPAFWHPPPWVLGFLAALWIVFFIAHIRASSPKESSKAVAKR